MITVMALIGYRPHRDAQPIVSHIREARGQALGMDPGFRQGCEIDGLNARVPAIGTPRC
jgi:hypothetical protein